MTAVPEPGLTNKSGHGEAHATADERVDGPDDPKRGGYGPGRLIKNAPHHGDDDDKNEAQDGSHLDTRTTITTVTFGHSPTFQRFSPKMDRKRITQMFI